MLNSLNAGVSTPRFLKSNKDYLTKLKINNSNLRLCVMDYIEGKTIYENNEKLSNDEIKFIAKQAALINSIDFKPLFTYDSWAISNFLKEFKEKNKYLDKNDFETLKPLVNDFKQLKIEELPHCFVHGDIISTNVIKDKKGKLWVIDFSVSNYYPRIQELAVLACDLLFNPKDQNESDSNLNIALKEYQKMIKLTRRELQALPVYVKLAHAMHVLCASHAKKALSNTSEENECYLEKGRSGLEQMVDR